MNPANLAGELIAILYKTCCFNRELHKPIPGTDEIFALQQCNRASGLSLKISEIDVVPELSYGRNTKMCPGNFMDEITIVWVYDIETVVAATREIQSEQRVSVICQKHNLTRRGPLDFIFMATEDLTVYVFDIQTLRDEGIDREAFDYGLREVLESKELEKLMFDCREDSDTLDKEHSTWLVNVIDVQLLDVLQRGIWRDMDVHELSGLRDCLVKVPGLVFSQGNFIWLERSNYVRQMIWGKITACLFAAYETLSKGIDMDLAYEASQRYVNHFRSYETLPDVKYIAHSYLPHNILTEPTSYDLECTGCLKMFQRNEFEEIHIRIDAQKCRVCRTIDGDVSGECSQQ